jgi:hypothetical protein
MPESVTTVHGGHRATVRAEPRRRGAAALPVPFAFISVPCLRWPQPLQPPREIWKSPQHASICQVSSAEHADGSGGHDRGGTGGGDDVGSVCTNVVAATGLRVCRLLASEQAGRRGSAGCQRASTRRGPSVCIGGGITLRGAGVDETAQGNGTTDAHRWSRCGGGIVGQQPGASC